MGNPPFEDIPVIPDPAKDITHARTNPKLRAYGKKIARDLALAARLVHGKYCKIFRPDRSGGRCTVCTDSITGLPVLHDCPNCKGTGEQLGVKLIGDTWAVPEQSPKVVTSSEIGTTEYHGTRDNIYVYNFAILRDRDLLWFTDEDIVYKIVDFEPQLGAVQGVLVSQFVQCCRLLPTEPEYKAVHSYAQIP